MFIKQVEEQLNRMSEAEKEEWILSQARLLEEREQQDFLMSLSGEKKIIYMPGRYKKFYSSAKRRRSVDIIQIDEALSGKE